MIEGPNDLSVLLFLIKKMDLATPEIALSFRNVLSSQEVVDFISERINKQDENGDLRMLSSISEEVGADAKII